MAAAKEKENSGVDATNPLYLHPNEGGLNITEKLEGVTNYRTWKRSVELALAGKRKLGFVTGLVKRDAQDEKKQEQWDTCNNVVISWLLATMSETVKKSVLYYSSARNMWLSLEKRITVNNGALKYKLTRELFDTKQGGTSVNKYLYSGRNCTALINFLLFHKPPLKSLS